MKLEPEIMRRTVRLSGGWETWAEDWRALKEALVVAGELDGPLRT